MFVGLNSMKLDDDLPYTSMNYANGRGYYFHQLPSYFGFNVTRRDLSKLPEEEINPL